MKNIITTSVLTIVVILLGIIGAWILFPEVTSDLLRKAERSAAGLEQHNIEVEGLNIEYLEGGQGDALVLLHGFSANKDNWTRIGKYFTPYFRVIAPDLPGFGESSLDPHGDYTIRTQAERVKAFIRALKIKSLHLGGSSMGGAIAGVYASLYLKDLKSLLLFSPGGVACSDRCKLFRLIEVGTPNPLIPKDAEEYEYMLDFVFVEKPFIPGPVKKALVQEAVANQPLYQKIFKQLTNSADIPLEDVMTGLPVPTLIIWGAKDRVLHVSGARILESVIPEARVEVIDGVGHLPMIEKPEKTAGLYLHFLGFQS